MIIDKWFNTYRSIPISTMFSWKTDADLTNMEILSILSSSRAISKYLGFMNTNNKERSAVSALGNNTPWATLCAGPANEKRRYK